MEDKELLQEEENNIISFIDENGEEVDFEYMDCIEYEGKEYLALLPIDEEDNSVVILEVEPVDEDNENYLSVEDEDVLHLTMGEQQIALPRSKAAAVHAAFDF